MDGLKLRSEGKTVHLPFYIPVQNVIDNAQPPEHLSCDWLSDPLAFGIYLFPLEIYRKMEELKKCRETA